MSEEVATEFGVLLDVPIYDREGNVIQVNKQVVKGLTADQIDNLKARIEDRSKKMAALRAARNKRDIHPMVVNKDHESLIPK